MYVSRKPVTLGTGALKAGISYHWEDAVVNDPSLQGQFSKSFPLLVLLREQPAQAVALVLSDCNLFTLPCLFVPIVPLPLPARF